MANPASPISLNRFACAIHDLPVSKLYDTVAELQNSQAHLVRSNREMQQFAVLGDEDCRDAIDENIEVLQRTQHKLDLLKEEIQSRGLLWKNNDETQPAAGQKSSTEARHQVNGTSNGEPAQTGSEPVGTQALQRATRPISQGNENTALPGLDL